MLLMPFGGMMRQWVCAIPEADVTRRRWIWVAVGMVVLSPLLVLAVALLLGRDFTVTFIPAKTGFIMRSGARLGRR